MMLYAVLAFELVHVCSCGGFLKFMREWLIRDGCAWLNWVPVARESFGVFMKDAAISTERVPVFTCRCWGYRQLTKVALFLRRRKTETYVIFPVFLIWNSGLFLFTILDIYRIPILRTNILLYSLSLRELCFLSNYIFTAVNEQIP